MVPRNCFIAVYTMSNKKHGTLYIGVTGNLPLRVWQHREGASEGFTKKYGQKSALGRPVSSRSISNAVFMDGRDNGPAMTVGASRKSSSRSILLYNFVMAGRLGRAARVPRAPFFYITSSWPGGCPGHP